MLYYNNEYKKYNHTIYIFNIYDQIFDFKLNKNYF